MPDCTIMEADQIIENLADEIIDGDPYDPETVKSALLLLAWMYLRLREDYFNNHQSSPDSSQCNNPASKLGSRIANVMPASESKKVVTHADKTNQKFFVRDAIRPNSKGISTSSKRLALHKYATLFDIYVYLFPITLAIHAIVAACILTVAAWIVTRGQ